MAELMQEYLVGDFFKKQWPMDQFFAPLCIASVAELHGGTSVTSPLLMRLFTQY